MPIQGEPAGQGKFFFSDLWLDYAWLTLEISMGLTLLESGEEED